MQRFMKFFSIAIILLTALPFTASADAITVPIHLTVTTYDATLYDGDVAVGDCLDTESGTSTSINARCALLQVASSSNWTLGTSWYPSYGIFLERINSYAPDSVNSRFWGYYSNGDIAFDALNAHKLSAGDHILLTYGINPLRVVVATTTPLVGSSTTLTSQYFDPMLFDWALATSTTFTIDSVATDSDAFGTFAYIPSTTSPSVISVAKVGFITSLPITLFPYQIIATTTAESASTTPTTPPGGSYTPDATHTIDIAKAVGFLRAHADADGVYSAPLYTDWVAIGLAGVNGADDMRAKLSSYMLTHTDPGTSLTDIERRAMALEALNIDPATGTTRDYIRELVTHFDGTQFGDAHEINDDIFALIPLLHAGYGANDEVISKTVATIVAAQDSDGSWGNIDLTAAAIEALTPVSGLPSVSDSIPKAKLYLHTAQGIDGGFGSSYATSWVLQAIVSMQNQNLSTDWIKNGKTPQDYLWLLQDTDGGVELASRSVESRVWATAYAIPASSGKDWNTLPQSFPKHSPLIVTTFGSTVPSEGEVLGASTTTASSTSSASTTTQIILPFILAHPQPESVSSATSSTSTVVKKTVTPHKKITLAKKVIAPSPVALTSTTILASTTKEETVVEASWKHVVVAPFQRLYQALSSWFH